MRLKLIAAAAAAAALLGSTIAQGTATPFVKRLKITTPVSDAAVTGTGPVALSGLSAAQRAAFLEGAAEFQAVETPEGGLGPIFNGNACAACHTAGGLGGASTIRVTRFGRVDSAGRFDPLDHLGGSLLQDKAIAPEALERVPAEANVVARRITTPLFGAGLIEAIPDLTIQLNALLPRGDGISGRAALVTDVTTGKQRVGRFGWKAQQATLLAFSADAYINEMGVTNRYFTTENAPNGNQALLAKYDQVPDIEDAVDPVTGRSDIDASADFMRFLAPLPPLRATASSLAGGAVFAKINCTGCHTPVMFTGANAVAALSFRPVPLYSDLLLHDMGALGDGIEQGPAKARELRTAPLWGLRARTAFLHDGRATTVDAAIRAHDGEAVTVRNRYVALSAAQRQQLLDFLNAN